jgi:hypothetical protein
MTTEQTPLGAIARGMAAGVIGTAAMTAAQELAAKLQSSGDGGQQDEESQGPQDPWEQASMPARVARRISEGVFHHEVPPERIPLLTNALHWAYGTGWGAVYGLIQGTFGGRSPRQGVLFGAGVWAMSYVQLVPMGLYELPWKYPPKSIVMELGYHVVYGVGVAGGHGLFDRR